jgi:hypothetical protein
LRRLDPGRIEALCQEYPEFAAAAQRFPMGYESVQWEHTGSGVCEDSMMVGHSRIVPMSEALANDFEEAFAEAFEGYEYDTDAEDPNRAPKECWRSTNEFRNILFKAGQHQGAAAAKHLEHIPDADIRLFAQIELCAGMAGLRQIGHTSVGHVPKSRRAEFNEAVLDSLPEEMQALLKARGFGKDPNVQINISGAFFKRNKKGQAD